LGAPKRRGETLGTRNEPKYSTGNINNAFIVIKKWGTPSPRPRP